MHNTHSFQFFILFLSTYNDMVNFYLNVSMYFLEIRYLTYHISAWIVSLNYDESILIIPLFLLIFYDLKNHLHSLIALILYILFSFYVKSSFGQYWIFCNIWFNWYNIFIFGQVRSICAWCATLLQVYCEVSCWNEFWGFQINLFDLLF